MPCHRCQGLMFPLDLLDEAGGPMHEQAAAWRCFACGDVVDAVIAENRVREKLGEFQLPDSHPRPRKLVGVIR